MKISKLLKGILLPFFLFAIMGSDCGEDEDPKVCEPFLSTYHQVFRLTDSSAKTSEAKTPRAYAECDAQYLIKFGWEDLAKFGNPDERSPMDNSFGGLKFEFRETAFGNSYTGYNINKITGENPDGKTGNIWVIEFVAPAPGTSGDNTYFQTLIGQDILEDSFNFWVNVTIEYSIDQ